MTKSYTIQTQGKENEMEIPEKLVEEIYQKCDKFYGRLFVHPEIKVSINERRRFIKQLITRISQTIADGELLLPGEEGRFPGYARFGYKPAGYYDLIALEGAGKEEGGEGDEIRTPRD